MKWHERDMAAQKICLSSVSFSERNVSVLAFDLIKGRQTIFLLVCGLTAEVNQDRGASPHTRPRRTARPILLGCSKTPLAKLHALVTGLILL